jgi:hypothetical protein
MVHFQCPLCQEIVNTKFHAQHFRTRHTDHAGSKYKCGICDHVSINIKCFTSHCKTHGSIFTNVLSTPVSSNTKDPPSVNFNASDSILDLILKFTLFLYCLKIPRKTSRLIATRVCQLIPAILSKTVPPIESLPFLVTTCFKAVNTEHKLFKQLTSRGYYVPPIKMILQSTLQTEFSKGLPKAKTKVKTATLIPLSKVFQRIFEMPGTLSKIRAHLQQLADSSVFTNFMQSEFWKKKIQNIEADVVLPVFFYFDDFGVDNPVGPKRKAHSIGGIYLKLPFLPIEIESKLDNIFSMYFIESIDKSLGNAKIFAPVIEELKKMEERGIDVTIDGESLTIKFVIGLVIGDNLGLNDILGFTRSFSANYPCRICKIKSDALRSEEKENPTLFRTKATYVDDIEADNLSQTGIREPCAFNSIASFHVWENYAVDVMHDIFEGVAHYDLAAILEYGLEQNLITIDLLNARKNNFAYGPTMIGNLSEDISADCIGKARFRMTSSEMLTFLQCLAPMIGDCFGEDDPVWNFLSHLLKIIDIILEPEVSESNIAYLQHLVAIHHHFYVNKLKKRLTPKFHNMTHYGTVMRMYGPLNKFSSIRLEGKHKPHKDYARVSFCRKNLPWSLAVKEQLHLSYRFFCNTGFNWNEPVLGPKLDPHLVRDHLPSSLTIPENATFHNWVVVNGVKYETGYLVQIGQNENLPQMSTATHFFYNGQNIFAIVRDNCLTTGFSYHFHCYTADILSHFTIRVLNINEILSFPTTLIRLPNSMLKAFIIKRQY